MDLDQAEFVIQRGARAKALLAQEDFAWIVNDQTEFHLAALVAAPPGPRGADAVIYHHTQQHALTELVAALRGFAAVGDAMQRAIEQMAENED